MAGKRVCVIGAGPSGMSILYHLEKLRKEGREVPEFVCYEKQEKWGGLWNQSWRTGTDQYGEPVHGSMYKYLWSNGPKEASLEFPEYTFEEHFGKPIPSFPPREVMFDYLQGRMNMLNIHRFIKFNTSVKHVTYDKTSGKFTVVTKDLPNDKELPAETFDYVINATGHFSVPNVPDFKGFETFPGRIEHSHNFRDAVHYKGDRILLIGSSYSAEDLALQTMKYGAKSVVLSYRKAVWGLKNWPENVSEKPILVSVDGSTATFKDGTTAEFDTIILCTGYIHYYPYMEECLRLQDPNEYYPDHLYKGTIWMKGGGDKLLYVGAQDQYYTWTMFDAQARWSAKYILGDVKLPKSRDDMLKSIADWRKRMFAIKDCHDEIDFQSAFVVDLAEESEYGTDLDIGHLFHNWENHKHKNIQTYRDHSHVSKFTGKESPVHHTKFMEAFDDSMKTYLKN